MSSSFARNVVGGKKVELRLQKPCMRLHGLSWMDDDVGVDSGYGMERVVLEETPKDSAYGRGWPSPVEVG